MLFFAAPEHSIVTYSIKRNIYVTYMLLENVPKKHSHKKQKYTFPIGRTAFSRRTTKKQLKLGLKTSMTSQIGDYK